MDRFIFGLKHMKNHATYQCTPSCNLNSPNYGALPLNASNQCLAPSKHEGDTSIMKKSMSLKFKHKTFGLLFFLTKLP